MAAKLFDHILWISEMKSVLLDQLFLRTHR